MEIISKYLSIVIITYNRAHLLDRTLNSLLSSPFRDCSITVLDNHSSDNTRNIVLQYQGNFRNLSVVTNKYNIGANANILRSVEYATTEYMWILADDDTYDFSDCRDVIDTICEGDADLLHVGGHKEVSWKPLKIKSPKEAIKNGFPFFKICSFLPANIFKVRLMELSLIDGYNNITNSYPHMPLFIKLYETDCSFYISNKKIVKAEIGAQNYTFDNVIEWWINTAYSYIKCNKIRLEFVFAQFFNDKAKCKYIRLLWLILKKNITLICMFKVLRMRNYLVSFFCLAVACILNVLAVIKKTLVSR